MSADSKYPVKNSVIGISRVPSGPCATSVAPGAGVYSKLSPIPTEAR